MGNKIKESTINRMLYVDYFDLLWDKIDNKSAIIGIMGLGYVGLPNAISKANKGFKVIGFDVNQEKVKKINNGESYISDVDSSELRKVIEERKFIATTDFRDLSLVDIVHICVPTPIDEHKQPILTYVEESAKMIARYILKGSLIILENTTYPLIIREIIVKELESNGFIVGDDIFVAYSPEKIDPLNKLLN
jgi:UDP-N-acetyl-D-glucosamine dehydrogenase